MNKNIATLVFVFCITQLFSQDITSFFSKTGAFLKANVSKGKVNYSAIHSNQNDLNELLGLAEKIKVLKDDAKVYQAFWINSYNLSVIKGIIDNYPTKSPLDNAGFFDKTTYNLAGKDITLNDIENELLRKEFKDARFHFVLVCGAIGCPPLIDKVYLPESLDEQLDIQTKLALNGDWDFKIFNNLYTQTKRDDGGVTKKENRSNFFTTTLETYTGVSKNSRINIGLIVNVNGESDIKHPPIMKTLLL